MQGINFALECDQEVDERWIAEAPEPPGIFSCGDPAANTMAKTELLALRVITNRLEKGGAEPVSIGLSLPSAWIPDPQRKGAGCSAALRIACKATVRLSQDS